MHDSFHCLKEVFTSLCEVGNTPVTLGLALRFKYGEFRQLVEFELPIGDYRECDVSRFEVDHLCSSLLKKFKGFETGIDLKAEAIRSFSSSEEQCRETNSRIRASRSRPIKVSVASVLYRAQRKISSLLGPATLFNIEPHFGWGPGATFDLKRRRAFLDTKMLSCLTVSSRALSLAESVLKLDRNWLHARATRSRVTKEFVVQDHCRVTTVPKSAKTDRLIAVEPTMNLFLQKGVGGYIRRRLRSIGVDLDDQRPNQDAAQAAWTEGLATLDLKAASDTVSFELVYELLPYEWASLLDDIRSRYALVDGKSVKLEKFSSMGNGFTFELESLVFSALAAAVLEETGTRGIFRVYGDDIVISRGAVPLLLEVLEFCGFTVNTAKSFVQGLFFESCGKHFFKGKDVTPKYQKEPLGSPIEIVRFHNRLARWLDHSRDRLDSKRILRILRRSVPSEFSRCVVPLQSQLDDGFAVDLSSFVASASKLDWNKGYLVRFLSPVTSVLPSCDEAIYANRLRVSGQKDFLRESSYNGFPNPVISPTSAEADGFHTIPTGSYLPRKRWYYPEGVCVSSRNSR